MTTKMMSVLLALAFIMTLPTTSAYTEKEVPNEDEETGGFVIIAADAEWDGASPYGEHWAPSGSGGLYVNGEQLDACGLNPLPPDVGYCKTTTTHTFDCGTPAQALTWYTTGTVEDWENRIC